VGAVSGRYDYVGSKKSATSSANLFFWNYENFIKTRQSRIKTLTGMSGCINSFRKALYEPLPPHIIEDLVEPLKILEKGYRIVFEPEALAYETTTDTVQQEFTMRIRVITQGMIGLMYMRTLFNPFKYGFVSFQLISHKVLRWFIPIFLIGIFICNMFIMRDNLFYALIFCCQVVFYSVALIGLFLQRLNRKLGLLGFPLYFCTLNLAALVSMVNMLKGENIVKWETQR
jgi:cellulose synthase/poly-beta-1,6-N-acetylglucosamine synthase-like glycosyltransferase